MIKIIKSLFIYLLLTAPLQAQTVNIDLGGESGSTTARIIQLFLIITILSIAPSLLVMVTSFTRIIIVFSIIRQAMASQQTPPNMVMVSLALFLTGFIMMPTFNQAWQTGIEPLIAEKIEAKEALTLSAKPFHAFMMKQVREKDLELFMNMHKEAKVEKQEDVPLSALIPAFMISELRRAFEIGFLIFLPFLVIDMIIASVLMSMGMMMLPPTMLAMPFKLIFFVLIDGWYMLAGSLVQSFK